MTNYVHCLKLLLLEILYNYIKKKIKILNQKLQTQS